MDDTGFPLKQSILSKHQHNQNRKSFGNVSLIVGFIACPCHLIITFPFIAAIGGGTIFAVLLTDFVLVFLIFGIIFVTGLGVGNYLINSSQSGFSANCDKCAPIIKS